MRKVLLAAMAALVLVVSCKKDDPTPEPTPVPPVPPTPEVNMLPKKAVIKDLQKPTDSS